MQIFIHILVNIIFKTQFVLTVKYIYYFMGACSSVQMLKGYIVRHRLGTPELAD